MRTLTFLMAETLAAHTPLVESLGQMFRTDMGQWWTPDACFFDLMRDKQAITAMVREIAGDQAADAHITEPAKKQKAIITACLSGNRTAKIENWMPRYMRFPAEGYTGRFVHAETVSEDEAENGDDDLA